MKPWRTHEQICQNRILVKWYFFVCGITWVLLFTQFFLQVIYSWVRKSLVIQKFKFLANSKFIKCTSSKSLHFKNYSLLRTNQRQIIIGFLLTCDMFESKDHQFTKCVIHKEWYLNMLYKNIDLCQQASHDRHKE